MKHSKFFNPNVFLGIFMLLMIAIGLIIVSDYGMSLDYDAGKDHSLYNLSYMTNESVLNPGEYNAPYNRNYYGPAFITAVQYINVKIKAVFPEVETLRVFYFSHFLTFQAGAVFLYLLAKRIINEWAALAAALLFATQPLLFGHAFINYKDIPFMAVFIASITVGFYMVDQVVEKDQELGENKALRLIKVLVNPRVILAGSLVGVATATRILGPAAAGIVLLYLGSRLKKKSVLPALAYSGWALLAAFISWPYLWSTKLNGFIDSWKVMSRFSWNGKILFNGLVYNAKELPRSFLPAMMAIQFTEPLLLLLLVGIGVGAYKVYRRKKIRVELALIYLWFLIPFTLTILIKPTMYDNFRQFFFIIPPLFIIAGIGLEFIFTKINHWGKNTLLVVAVLLPGVLAIVTHHPYQYVYYNQLVGGVEGAFRRFELDYWLTAYQEAVAYLNQNGDADAYLFVRGISRFQIIMRTRISIFLNKTTMDSYR